MRRRVCVSNGLLHEASNAAPRISPQLRGPMCLWLLGRMPAIQTTANTEHQHNASDGAEEPVGCGGEGVVQASQEGRKRRHLAVGVGQQGGASDAPGRAAIRAAAGVDRRPLREVEHPGCRQSWSSVQPKLSAVRPLSALQLAWSCVPCAGEPLATPPWLHGMPEVSEAHSIGNAAVQQPFVLRLVWMAACLVWRGAVSRGCQGWAR